MTRALPPAVLFCLAVSTVHAQAPAKPSVTCEAVLTADEASAIVGSDVQGPSVTEYRPGFTGCDWQGEGRNFSFTFASLKNLADEETTAEQYFELEVSKLEDDTRKRELVPGIGVRAAIVGAGEDALMVVVQRADGVARMITYKVDREKALALGRAIAEP